MEVKKEADVRFGRPYVGDGIDVKGIYIQSQIMDEPEIVDFLRELGFEDATEEHVETALEYAEENRDEMEALEADDAKLRETDQYSGVDDSDYRAFLNQHNTDFSYILE